MIRCLLSKAKVVWDSIGKTNFRHAERVKANQPRILLLLYPFVQALGAKFPLSLVFAPIALWMLAVAIVVAAAARGASTPFLAGVCGVGLATLPLSTNSV
jgi:hypothetical protein